MTSKSTEKGRGSQSLRFDPSGESRAVLQHWNGLTMMRVGCGVYSGTLPGSGETETESDVNPVGGSRRGNKMG